MIEKIDNLFIKMQTEPLSEIIPLVYPIALQCQDYKGFCMLFHWATPFHESKAANTSVHKDMVQILESEGLVLLEIQKLQQDVFLDYSNMRRVDNDQVSVLCAKELEDQIKLCEDLISELKPVKLLDQVSQYVYDQSVQKTKVSIIQKRQIFEKQYAVLRAYLATKLTQYKRCFEQREKQEAIRDNIRNSKDVFIIHGHNEAKRRELVSLLRDKFGLNPIVLADQSDQGLTIIEKFEKYAATSSYAFALFTPDDIVNSNGQQYFQARPNVIFELGWFYANLGRSRVCILDQASDASRIFSDLQGVMRMQFQSNISEKYLEIERELKNAGIIK